MLNHAFVTFGGLAWFSTFIDLCLEGSRGSCRLVMLRRSSLRRHFAPEKAAKKTGWSRSNITVASVCQLSRSIIADLYLDLSKNPLVMTNIAMV